MMRQTPFRHDRTAPADNTRHPVGGQRNMCQTNTGVDGEIIHTLLGLFN